MDANDRLVIEIPFGLPGKIYRSPMPFSRFDPRGEVWPAYREREIEAVIILTEPQEYLVYARRDLPSFYRSQGLDVIASPIPDFSVPNDRKSFREALEFASDELRAGRNLAVHCYAGVGRTGTFLACLAKQLAGKDGQTAIEWVRARVPGAWKIPPKSNLFWRTGSVANASYR